jgi:hypothetical protein
VRVESKKISPSKPPPDPYEPNPTPGLPQAPPDPLDRRR